MNINTPMNRLTSYIFATLLFAPLASLHAAEVANLRGEYRENPLGIDVAKPRLSWVIEARSQKSEVRNRRPIKCWWRVPKSC